MSEPTPAQRAAIDARGRLLVVAGAGAGKTRTLVEHCFGRLTAAREPVSPERMLLVTFTKAAASEMRRRLRERLQGARDTDVDQAPLEEAIALLESARIGTLHQFCLDLVRENFDALDLDPRLTALEQDRRESVAEHVLDDLLEAHYSRRDEIAVLVRDWAGGRDGLVRHWVRKIHDYSRTLRRPEEWLAGQEALFQHPDPTAWERWFVTGAAEWARDQRARICGARGSGAGGRLDRAFAELESANSRAAAAGPLSLIMALCEDRETKKAVKGVKEIREDAAFLDSLCAPGAADPLREDWEWCRRPMLVLLALAREYGAEFSLAKREAGALDFHDMEQFALRLLWNEDQSRPSPVAETWRSRLDMILVDEYQDINEAQDWILRALSREGDGANYFLVGDVKQSIYRFRLADPRIFLRCQSDWTDGRNGRVIHLSDNFRSHEGILNFVNAIFRRVMRRRVGGIDYVPDVELRFGNAAERPEQAAVPGGEPRVELLLRRIEKKPGGAGDDPDAEPVSGIEAEALMIGERLRALRDGQFVVGPEPRPVEWRDMAVLLRAPSEKRPVFLKTFQSLGIPLETGRSGVMESMEVLDLESLLRILDNPLQDMPLLAVLRSPFGGFTPAELLEIRIILPAGDYWAALQAYRVKGSDGALRNRVARFLDWHDGWRSRCRREPLSLCLESILNEAFYREWIQAGDRVGERLANTREFIRMTREFDEFQREGLFRFIQHVDRRREIDAELDSPFEGDANAVRLLSVHQSKGLEFPVVVVADLGKRFNFEEINGDIVLDDERGLCPVTRPPGGSRAYPSLALWLARRSIAREALGEELRLLYVAMTRAAGRLILSGTASASRIEEKWGEQVRAGDSSAWIGDAGCAMDWIGCWLVEHLRVETLPDSGRDPLLDWRILSPGESISSAKGRSGDGEAPAESTGAAEDLDFGAIRELENRLSWNYPFTAAQSEPGKTSVTAMRRRAAEEDEDSSHAGFLAENRGPDPSREAGGLGPADVGVAHHLFLQWANPGRLATVSGCGGELRRLVAAGVLNDAQASVLDLESFTAFWQGDLGRRIVENSDKVRRELAFTARFAPSELAEFGAVRAQPGLEDEFVVVQGVVDLAVILPSEIWLVDFKTDRIATEELAGKVEKYRPQLLTYARALEKAYRRPVSETHLHFLSPRKTVVITARAAAEPPVRPGPTRSDLQ